MLFMVLTQKQSLYKVFYLGKYQQYKWEGG